VVKAFIVPDSDNKPSVQELHHYMQERIEQYAIPRQFVWVTELPRTASGKIQRHLLRERK